MPRRWAPPIVVFHPENVSKINKPNLQVLAFRNIKALQRETPVTIAIETFGGKKRVITPEEIIEKGLPMVLDTSHLFPQRTFNMIKTYAHGIEAVHLSEERFDAHESCSMPHMPVEEFGIEVLKALKGQNWDGVVTLEYLPWYHDRLIPDVMTLTEKFGRKKGDEKDLEVRAMTKRKDEIKSIRQEDPGQEEKPSFFTATGEEIESVFRSAAKDAIARTHAMGRPSTHGDEKGIYRLYPDGHKEYIKIYFRDPDKEGQGTKRSSDIGEEL